MLYLFIYYSDFIYDVIIIYINIKLINIYYHQFVRSLLLVSFFSVIDDVYMYMHACMYVYVYYKIIS